MMAILKNNTTHQAYVFKPLKDDKNICGQLKMARNMYLLHQKHNNTETRESNLRYWGNICMSLREQLSA